jgi:GTP cyclohydrolase I
MNIDKEKIREGIRLIIEALGENPEREGLRDTPQRVAQMWEDLLGKERDELPNSPKLFRANIGDQLILIKDIYLLGLCEHHLLPFIGKAHIAYLPQGGRIVGLSTIVRWANSLAKRLQLQEQLTHDLAARIMQELKPKGVLVIIEAEHICMLIRGIKPPGSSLITTAKQGTADIRAEVFTLMKGFS